MNYLLCQSRKSLISKLRHLLWLTASESSKIHKVFSAVHPCQPQNLLLLFHSLGFSIDLFWNWLTWVSKPTIKVPQVSVLFNFQGPAALSALVDSLFIIHHQVPFVKNFFEVFSDFLKKFCSSKTRTSCCYGLFSGRPSRDSLTILPQVVILCQQVFWIFWQISGGIFGQCVYCGFVDERAQFVGKVAFAAKSHGRAMLAPTEW